MVSAWPPSAARCRALRPFYKRGTHIECMTVKQPDMCRLILIKGHTGYSGYMYSMQSGECQRLLHLGYYVNKYVWVEVNKKGNKLSSGVGTSTSPTKHRGGYIEEYQVHLHCWRQSRSSDTGPLEDQQWMCDPWMLLATQVSHHPVHIGNTVR